MMGRTRREWLAELAKSAEEYDDLSDAEAKVKIQALILESIGQSDYLLQIELVRNRRIRLGNKSKGKAPTETRELDLTDLLPSREFTPNPGAGPPLKKSHPLGNRNLVSRKHQ